MGTNESWMSIEWEQWNADCSLSIHAVILYSKLLPWWTIDWALLKSWSLIAIERNSSVDATGDPS